METSKTATEDGWRELINEQRQQHGDCQVTLAQFDTVYEVVYPPTDIASVPDGRMGFDADTSITYDDVRAGNTAAFSDADRDAAMGRSKNAAS
jgi:hypothetical protein